MADGPPEPGRGPLFPGLFAFAFVRRRAKRGAVVAEIADPVAVAVELVAVRLARAAICAVIDIVAVGVVHRRALADLAAQERRVPRREGRRVERDDLARARRRHAESIAFNPAAYPDLPDCGLSGEDLFGDLNAKTVWGADVAILHL